MLCYVKMQQRWHLYCFAILGSTSIVTHSVKQCLLKNHPGSDAATSRDFLHKRLQRAFTHVQTSLTEPPNRLTISCLYQTQLQQDLLQLAEWDRSWDAAFRFLPVPPRKIYHYQAGYHEKQAGTQL